MKKWKLKTLKIVPFTVAPINNKYLGVHLIKYVLALYIFKINKTVMREII